MSTKVNVDIIRSFATAVSSTFEQMCSIKLGAMKPYLKNTCSSIYGISAVVGLAGDVTGVVVLTLPESVAFVAVGNFASEKYDAINAAVVDGVKELANIICGMAKSNLDSKGYQYSFGLPKVVVGTNYISHQSTNLSTIVIPFDSPSGQFQLEVTVRHSEK